MRANRASGQLLLIVALAACRPGGDPGDGVAEAPPPSIERQPTPTGVGNQGATHPLPEPPLELVEPDVAEQLRAARSGLEAALAAGVTGSDLGERYGRAGQLHQAYGLWQAAELCYREAASLAADDATWNYYLAITLQMQGRLEEAGRLLDRVVAEGTIGGPALLRLGQVRLELGDFEASLAAFEGALALAPESAAARAGAGRALLELGRTAEALPDLQRALELEPRATRLHHLLARAYRRLGDAERAGEELKASGEGDVRVEDPWQDRVQALAQGAAAALRRGDGALLAGEYAAAAAAYGEAVELAPDNISARHSLAVALVRAGREQEGRRAFEQALARAPEDVDLLLSLAALEQRSGERQVAIGHLRRAVELDPDLVDARLRFASALAAEDRLAAALDQLDAALQREPTNVAAAVERALLLDRLGRREEGLATLEEVVAMHPGEPEPRLRLANLLAAAGDYAAAVRHYSQLLAREPDDVALRLLLVTALALDGRTAAAVGELETALARAPGDPDLAWAMSVLLSTANDESLRDGERALALARQALAAGATVERAEAIALALAESGHFVEAAAWQEKILGGAPEQIMGRPLASRLRANLERFRAGRRGLPPWQDRAAEASAGGDAQVFHPNS